MLALMIIVGLAAVSAVGSNANRRFNKSPNLPVLIRSHFIASFIAICPGVLRSERLEMIPYWIELNPADLIQGTVVMSLAVYFFIFTLTSSVRRA
jgi:hypothetical protein